MYVNFVKFELNIFIFKLKTAKKIKIIMQIVKNDNKKQHRLVWTYSIRKLNIHTNQFKKNLEKRKFVGKKKTIKMHTKIKFLK